ncbi:MAG: enoyl-CoA hydratase/isomerase family protein [Saprospiraceae bacterium]|nr:enoyl-CoA hydratase/isomerase family protein [Candidatus Vicinibacter affinis]MBK6571981.1 enoyl-CoA hydratase/isomerase family protein [Candidatus Vicinibacter affinis]MBK7799364.1 enoyl-CoA hydratase/isomerase family protein [Candidatus Vicinibacter affinis]MBK8403578.1 enoyl-CoA hydratase/isomerase family protein [Candidatus Vicinibacter affinis]MBK8642861.1 enoyl-CoA hydratase/isomerase family protein [Candidatus Vicinibacter affinis]
MGNYVKRFLQDQVETIEFFTDQSNSLPSDILSSLADTIDEISATSECPIILLKSGGDKAFCAGASFDELASITDLEHGKKFFMGFANVILAMRRSPKIILGRIQGKAVGGGVGLASGCDYTFSTTFASVRLSELAVGIGPFVIGPAVERKIGVAAFSQMALNATEWQTALWAKDKGLFQEVFETTEQMDAYISHFSKILLESNPLALIELKKVFWERTEHWLTLLPDRAEISGRLVLSEYTRDAISRFKNTR